MWVEKTNSGNYPDCRKTDSGRDIISLSVRSETGNKANGNAPIMCCLCWKERSELTSGINENKPPDCSEGLIVFVL